MSQTQQLTKALVRIAVIETGTSVRVGYHISGLAKNTIKNNGKEEGIRTCGNSQRREAAKC